MATSEETRAILLCISSSCARSAIWAALLASSGVSPCFINGSKGCLGQSIPEAIALFIASSSLRIAPSQRLGIKVGTPSIFLCIVTTDEIKFWPLSLVSFISLPSARVLRWCRTIASLSPSGIFSGGRGVVCRSKDCCEAGSIISSSSTTLKLLILIGALSSSSSVDKFKSSSSTLFKLLISIGASSSSSLNTSKLTRSSLGSFITMSFSTTFI